MYRLPSRSIASLRTVQIASLLPRHFSTSPACPASSPLFHLQAFSNSRESKWLAKGSGLSPIEHSAQLQLIRSSEGLDPYSKRKPVVKAPPTLRKGGQFDKPAATEKLPEPTPIIPISPESILKRRLRSSVSDKTAVSIGRAILARHAAQRITYKRRMRKLDKRARRFYRRLQERTLLIVISIAAAVGSGVWVYYQDRKIEAREAMMNMKERAVKKQTVPDPVTDDRRRLEALYTTPEVHELLEWQRALGALEAIEAQEIQNAAMNAKARPWWHRLFWS